jgi:hypothetical protein
MQPRQRAAEGEQRHWPLPKRAASIFRGCARPERECALTGGSREGAGFPGSVTLAALLGPVQEHRTIMGKPSVLDALDQCPSDLVDGQSRVIDRTMDCALVDSTGPKGRGMPACRAG